MSVYGYDPIRLAVTKFNATRREDNARISAAKDELRKHIDEIRKAESRE